MEPRASYLLVGAFVLVLVAGLAGFVVWLVGIRADRDVALYDIAFTGSVTGLQTGGQVRYLGVPVGRVDQIRIAPGNIGRVLVTVQIDQPRLIREDTIASLEMLGITGIAYVQLSEGSEAAPPLRLQPGRERPLIPSVPSTLEQVFDAAPELLARGVELLERLTGALDEANLTAFGNTLQNLEGITGILAGRTGDLDQLVVETGEAVAGVRAVAAQVGLLAGDIRQLVGQLTTETAGMGDELGTTLREVQGSVRQLSDAARQLEGVVREVRGPLGDFAGTGLYDFTQLIGETRLLVAALSRITTELERDPAGFLLGTNQRGFQPP